MGFIGYRQQPAAGAERVIRIYMECRDEENSKERPNRSITCGSAVDVAFFAGSTACQLRGIENVLSLKKFYKLVFSLEERAREHGNDWRSVMTSPERLLELMREAGF